MNQRIKELAKEADEYASQFSHLGAIDHPSHIDKFNQKFAELIVKECADLCDSYQDIPATEPRHCANDIRSLFGVKQ